MYAIEMFDRDLCEFVLNLNHISILTVRDSSLVIKQENGLVLTVKESTDNPLQKRIESYKHENLTQVYRSCNIESNCLSGPWTKAFSQLVTIPTELSIVECEYCFGKLIQLINSRFVNHLTGNLNDHLTSRNRALELGEASRNLSNIVLLSLKHVAQGMAFLSRRQLHHNNLSGGNILLSINAQWKIGDFATISRHHDACTKISDLRRFGGLMFIVSRAVSSNFMIKGNYQILDEQRISAFSTEFDNLLVRILHDPKDVGSFFNNVLHALQKLPDFHCSINGNY